MKRTPYLRCHSADCIDAATHLVDWPGRRSALACQKHADMALEIARALGILIRVERGDREGL